VKSTTTPALAVALSLLYVSVIAAANWAIQRFGIVPIGFGLLAPAGVFFAGLAFSLRDWLQETGGRRWVLGAILAGAGLSAWLSGPQLAAASGLAFLLSELADFAVYTPLRRRGWLAAVIASNAVGVVVDSALFLTLAGFGLGLLPGQIIAKLYMTGVAVALVWAWRRSRDPRRAPVVVL
jgi:uncharacterized PurR-regulated membrane protein YhhQ (DUF165 family)